MCLDALDENQDACEPQQIKAQKTLDSVRTQAQPVHAASGLAYQHSQQEKGVLLRGP